MAGVVVCRDCHILHKIIIAPKGEQILGISLKGEETRRKHV